MQNLRSGWFYAMCLVSLNFTLKSIHAHHGQTLPELDFRDGKGYTCMRETTQHREKSEYKKLGGTGLRRSAQSERKRF